MSSDILQRFMQDLIKSAKETEGFIPGSRMTVEVGATTKVANNAALGSLAGGLILPGIGAPIGAALGADEGQRGSAALGSIGGGVLGGAAGAAGGGLLGLLAGHPELGAMIGSGLGGVGGMMYGAHRGGEREGLVDRMKSKLSSAAEDGVKAAAARFGVKEALLPALLGMAGSMVGGMGARALGAKVAPTLAKGIGGHAMEMGGQMAGGAIANRMMGPQGP